MTTTESGQKHKILVVDDEPDLEPLMLQRMRRYIRTGVYEFVFARNGVEALEALDMDESIDMVLSDINMPKMDGLTLLERIPDVAPDIRAVIISAYGDMKNIRIAMNRGAFDFVTKPVDFDDLKFTIDRTLQHIREWREALSARDKLVVLQNELNVASMMQQSILPNKFARNNDYKLFGTMQPARNVGGDFFDVVGLSDGKVGLAIADVSGKGVPAALFMMSSRTLLKGAAMRADGPGEALAEVNDVLNEDNDACMFVTMI
ncbi:MAG: response regulator, partial [Acidimicrobiaceae bacterium]|nr:response regulator [Acidimicrobiaceae bacterium]